MKLKQAMLPALVMTGLILGAGCGGSGGPPKVAAVVEGMKVQADDTEGLVDAYLERHVSDPQQQGMPRSQVSKLVLGYQIKLALLEHKAMAMAVSDEAGPELEEAADLVNPDGYALIGERRQDYVNELRAGRLSKAIAKKLYPDVDVSESDLLEEYERRAPLLDRHWKATTTVARFDSQAPIDQLRSRVTNGEPFDQVASAVGSKAVATVEINPLTAPLAAPVLDAIGKTPAGQMSAAVPLGKEFLVVFVTQRRDLPRLTLDDLRPELTDALSEQERYRLFQEWFGKQLEKAEISVDGHYGKWSPEYSRVT